EPAAGHGAVREQLLDDAVHRISGDGGRKRATQAARVDAEYQAFRIDQGAAAEPRIEPHIRLQPEGELPAFPPAPAAARRAARAEGCPGSSITQARQRQHEV